MSNFDILFTSKKNFLKQCDGLFKDLPSSFFHIIDDG